jgi:hypothetical protein
MLHTGKSGRWDDVHIGRKEDQPLILAVILVLIAITLVVFL